ncbi:hypothetical protein MLD38_011406 [Melastoma candidum]|uniref:Uncharacterized protein n=1 Tax=Melastoma candidum TaxID=119954 RepID=A0ACB9R6H8_9MYRT|nr:hypothetical protein MLD38_011406 [Melastoma candidum]
MEARTIPSCVEAVKRLWRWRRRRYQRLPWGGSPGRRRLKVVRLGGSGDGRTTTTKPNRGSRLGLKLSALSPSRLLARFHDAYVEMMMGVAIGVARCKTVAGKGACREDNQVSVGSTGEEVDQRLVLAVYRRIATSRQLVAES